jgi:hypothetical protein
MVFILIVSLASQQGAFINISNCFTENIPVASLDNRSTDKHQNSQRLKFLNVFLPHFHFAPSVTNIQHFCVQSLSG